MIKKVFDLKEEKCPVRDRTRKKNVWSVIPHAKDLEQIFDRELCFCSCCCSCSREQKMFVELKNVRGNKKCSYKSK